MSSPDGSDSRMQRQPANYQQASRMQAWLQARARLESRLLIQAPPWVRGVFDHAWAPMRALARQTCCLPEALCDRLLEFDTGYVAIHAAGSYYAPGPAVIRQRRVQNVAFVSVEDLAMDNERPLHVIGHLIDHHLGCAGRPAPAKAAGLDPAWLTDGGGLSPQLKSAGARLPRLFSLGYAVDDVASSDVRNYFAQSLAFYCRNRRHLNVGDPQIYKWFRSTLWNEAFWHGQRF